MTAWSAGYVSDIDYVPGFYRAQSPSLMDFGALLNGYEPAPGGAAFTYCELGCGLGQTVALLAPMWRSVPRPTASSSAPWSTPWRCARR
jgi:hypothetical protein